jgi:DNA-binding response OmpR family regulator
MMMKRILIIEDEESIAELERDYLEINGFYVEIESRGDSGIKRALHGDYDLVILDVMLPGMNGFEVCRLLRAKKNIPVLLGSAKKEDIDKIRGLGLGADDYITKPFSPGELVARVRAHLSRYERLTESAEPKRDDLKIRGLVIDTYARRVYVNGNEVKLTAKEYALLLFLASNPDRVFSKDELFEKVWGLDSMGDLATLTVHIRKIREKIEADPANPQYIKTIWGVGYRFES